MSNVQTIIEGTKLAIEGAAVAGTLTIVKIAIDGLMDVGVEFLKAKKDKLVQQLGADKYNQKRQLAVDIYNRVEQEFKGQIGVAEEKLKAFDKYLAEKIPGIDQEDIQHFRESITGDANKKLLESGVVKPADTQKSAQVTTLTQENAALKQKLANINIQSTATVQEVK
ncbi:hypothetical protein OSC52_15175 [Clostridium pasteurianum]|uniref:hypothetical protein n=1 Tax=Clostridium pasteurianum TaxID=1501 RepID=UPI002260A115|nr:hypothetical protein [Clostridium pasteurianum]UZW13178.1 hypothetical protein OSC52_15175 [Clostridium pasteurianum]